MTEASISQSAAGRSKVLPDWSRLSFSAQVRLDVWLFWFLRCYQSCQESQKSLAANVISMIASMLSTKLTIMVVVAVAWI